MEGCESGTVPGCREPFNKEWATVEGTAKEVAGTSLVGAIMSTTTVAERGEARSVVDKEQRLGLQPAALKAAGPER